MLCFFVLDSISDHGWLNPTSLLLDIRLTCRCNTQTCIHAHPSPDFSRIDSNEVIPHAMYAINHQLIDFSQHLSVQMERWEWILLFLLMNSGSTASVQVQDAQQSLDKVQSKKIQTGDCVVPKLQSRGTVPHHFSAFLRGVVTVDVVFVCSE